MCVAGQSRDARFGSARGRDTHLGTGVPAPHQQGGDGLGDGVPDGWAHVVVGHVRRRRRCERTAPHTPVSSNRTASQQTRPVPH